MVDKDGTVPDRSVYHVWQVSDEHGEVHRAQVNCFGEACNFADAAATESGEECFVTSETIVYRSWGMNPAA